MLLKTQIKVAVVDLIWAEEMPLVIIKKRLKYMEIIISLI